jgi:glycerol uptake operon antiterminator
MEKLEYPIVAAVRDVNHMKEAIESRVEVIFLMSGDIFTIEEFVAAAKKYQKKIFLHIDLIKGIANDKEGLRYIAKRIKPDGIVSTKNQLIHAAKKEGLLTIHQVFLIDTQAYETAIKNVLDTKPDMVEIMPGLMPRIIRQLSQAAGCPIVAAGLIKTQEEIAQALDAGAYAVAIGERQLWTLVL